ncbi:putative peptidase family-domain-containing protein [Mycena amicta]|nr:putative peptidase family-domain-containing protein [Mycena amicta]
MPKRPASPALGPRPAKIKLVDHDFVVDVQDGETVHQHCLLLAGQCKDLGSEEEDFVSVHVTDTFGRESSQSWPAVAGKWKALTMLSPGSNTVSLTLHHQGAASPAYELKLNYQPLLQLPPLHLAIMVAKDSPLLIDCPPAKLGAISTAHSGLEAAIAKFRMAAYMWQAQTAEDFRLKGLGRRSFRLDEEWAVDTTSRVGFQSDPAARLRTGAVPKVHIIRSEKTVAELRDAQVAQQNPNGRRRDDLHKFFEDALRAHGSPFSSSERPVVAGLILDSHYSIEQDLILGHAALGCHKADGVSLGVFGSHLTYSWPRFLEEVPACLLDQTLTGDTVGNDNGECKTMREACFVGQGAFLHEVGHAFSADHTTGIMARGYSRHWARNFLAHEETENHAVWDLQDALKFRVLEHFLLPGDPVLTQEERQASADITCEMAKDDEPVLQLACKAGIAQIEVTTADKTMVVYQAELLAKTSLAVKTQETITNSTCDDGRIFSVPFADLEKQFDRTKSLSMSILGLNGKKRVCEQVWKMLAELPFIRVPGTSVVLRKTSIKSDWQQGDANQQEKLWRWAMLLQRKRPDGTLERASAIDLRVGAIMDGAVVHYEDGGHVNCGPVSRNGHPHTFGGHASQKRNIPVGANITKVQINAGDGGWGCLAGIRMTLDNGTHWGELNGRATGTLQPQEDERVVGLFGRSQLGSGFAFEFGIITVKKEAGDLPEVVYDMPELQNLEGEKGVNGDVQSDETMDDEDEENNSEENDEDEE